MAASDMSAVVEASVLGRDPAFRPAAITDVRAQLGSAVAGLGAGILAGAIAQSQSQRYGAQESAALRVTAHATVPFFVAASVLADHAAHRRALPFRCGFFGAHVVHIGQIVRLLRDHGTDRPIIRAELAGGVPLYGLLALQAALACRPAQGRLGAARAERSIVRIDTQLLRVYCLAVASGLLRYRRPLSVYVCLATLLASALADRKRSR
jgi:hypothetical protein